MRIVIFLLGYACGLATIVVAAFVINPPPPGTSTPQASVDEKIATPSIIASDPVAPTSEPPKVSPVSSARGWAVVDDRDPIDDGQRIAATLSDESGKARIELGCKRSKDGKNFLLAFVVLPGFYMSGPGANVVYRINNEPPIEGERWGKCPDSANTLWILEPYPFLRRLKDDDSLFIRARDLASDTRMQEARFNLANYTSTLTTLITGCPEPSPTAGPPVATKAQGKK